MWFRGKILFKIPMLTVVALIPLKKNSLKLRLYFLNSPPLIHFWPSKISSLGENLARDYGLNLPLMFSPFFKDPIYLFPAPNGISFYLHYLKDLFVFPFR